MKRIVLRAYDCYINESDINTQATREICLEEAKKIITTIKKYYHINVGLAFTEDSCHLNDKKEVCYIETISFTIPGETDPRILAKIAFLIGKLIKVEQ